MKRPDLNRPVRALKTSRRCLTGKVSLSAGGNASFESSLERDWLIALDFNPSVCRILEQPFSIYYNNEGQRRRYTPDFLAEYLLSGNAVQTVVYEVKPIDELRAEWDRYRARFKAAVQFCRSQGWRFKIVTEREIRTPAVDNAKFLRRYRNISEQPLFSQQLIYTLKSLGETTPQALLAASYLHEEKQMAAIPELWRLVSTQKIRALLDEPLSMQSSIWLAEV